MKNDIFEVIRALLERSGADAYEVTEERETGWEFYFIRHKLDQNRAKDVTTLKIKVFKKSDDGKFLGNATGDVPPTASKDEIEKLISDLVYQASLVKNPYYELNGLKEAGVEDGDDPNQEALVEVDIEKMAEDFIETLNAIPETATEDLNSYEIFVSKKEKHFINSNGIDQRTSYPKAMIEVVTNARHESKEIELYRIYNRGTCDRAALTQDIVEVLNMGRDRLEAVPTPHLKEAPLILSTQDSVWMFDYFFDRMNASYKYRGFSDWEIGKPIADDVKGDKITITAVPMLPNSSRNYPFDEEGAKIKEKVLIRDNIPENYWGGRQFSQYMGLEDSSNVYNYKIEGGSKSAEEIRKGPYIEVVEFSGFDCDAITGDIAGEIRLGYYHDGEKIIKVTGGSVSGSMRDLAKEMYLSKELRQYDFALVPAVVRLEHATIAGIEG
ncbi:MAG: TldD/PmbA family protein [Firmicutes bacterium]|nr:TldD/PmbA family protein [Bacillota bacterium]